MASDIEQDYIDVDCKIRGNPWHIVEAEVKLTQAKKPNYVDMIISPDREETVPLLPDPADIYQIIGDEFTLKVDNSFDAQRQEYTTAQLESDYKTLFDGEISNITPTGVNTFEALAHDPMQQPFNAESGSGSILNQNVESVVRPKIVTQSRGGTTRTFGIKIKKASSIIAEILREVGIDPESDSVNIDLEDGGKEFTLANGETITAAYDENIKLDSDGETVLDLLNRAAEQCRAEWWFDQYGTFNFGFPEPNVHKLQYITDSSAGLTTPPYQSVIVVGEGAASEAGYERGSLLSNPNDAVVKRGRIGTPFSTDSDSTFIILGETAEPVFTYRNAEISTDQQAKNTVAKILDEFIKQQADGEITLVGFPEMELFDGLEMPGGSDEPGGPVTSAPMGGQRYGVYEITHRLNASDGFITKVKVSGPTGATRSAFKDALDQEVISAEVDATVYEYDFTPGPGR